MLQWIWFLDSHSSLENNRAFSLFRAFIMSMATCSGSALHPEASLALNIPLLERSTLFPQLLAFKGPIPWEERKRLPMIRLIYL